MNVKEKGLRGYVVAVRVVEDVREQLLVCFVPRVSQHEKDSGGKSGRAPEFVARAFTDGDKITVVWENTPPSKARKERQEEAERRMVARLAWFDRLTELVLLVQRYAEELGWATKQIKKRMEDSYIGDYQVYALLLQKETTRVLLEPAGRSAPGAEGVVDLYLLPGYEDIATLYYYDDKWHWHYLAPGTPAAASGREAEAKPLSKATLRKVLEEMTKNAQ
ncbi:MAG TPA: hypothetical protein VH682_04875 [Gemmataceae bacterium]|jgi:hypothetical protein